MFAFILSALYGLCCGIKSERQDKLLNRVFKDVEELTHEELEHLKSFVVRKQPVKQLRCCY